VEDVLQNAAVYQQQITENKQHQFAHLGQSATLIADNILAALAGATELPTPAIKSQVEIDRNTYHYAEKLAAEGDLKLSTQVML
ncbi:hypothetical protein, partial [Staphylococcus aureus]|uniref:hypothetical protein n=1 Tax=Staphylococcus aureus TaxID=1280 RepID=UPI003A7F8860